MANKHNASRWRREAADLVSGWQSAITAHHSMPTKSTWQHLAELAQRAAMLAESDPNPGRRARHEKLLRYLAQRIARSILREVGRR